MMDADVLIVGGGPVGMSLAVELGLQGCRCVLIERDDRSGLAPRAKTTNVRSRELMRRWGIAERLAAAAPFGIDYPSNVVFATRLTGRELARFSNAFYCSPVRDDRFAEHAQWIPQYKVEQVLRTRAAEFPGVELRMATQLEDWRDIDGGIEARLTDRHSGRSYTIRASYLVGADGARSTVRERLGIRMQGASPLSHNHNIVFRSPGLAQRHPLGPAVMYWLINSEVPSVVAPLDRGDYWTFGCPKLAQADSAPADLIRAALGLEIDIEIVSRDEWTAHQLIADQYRSGRAFLVGDACHLHPPYGGHGMNMGIGDAVDLGWKLAAVTRGWGGERLLDSYEIERRQVHRRVVDEAVFNHGYSSRRLTVDGIEDEGPDGDAVRAAVGAQILATKRREFDSLGVVIGGGYRHSPVLAVEDSADARPTAAAALAETDSSTYVPSARPGSRAPHAWLADGRANGASLYDHFAVDSLTLLIMHGAARAAADEAAAAAAEAGIPLRVIEPGGVDLRSLYEADLALIRPDQHVAWRGRRAADARAALMLACGRGP
ncbi:MAG: FAD-dependent monooxygenase [Burkholderiaceae bacterium]